MGELHPSIAAIPMPPKMKALPLTEKGFPVLWFADEVDGKPDLRVMDGRKLARAIKEGRCWLCGQLLGVHKAFVIGPMCAITRTTSEPPSHLDCALYAMKACPFLTRPKVHRREACLPEDARMSGTGIMRNPGVTTLWVSKSYRVWHPKPGQLLITVGKPERVEWWAEGREATRAEVMASIESGLPILYAECDRDSDPVGARSELDRRIFAVQDLLP